MLRARLAMAFATLAGAAVGLTHVYLIRHAEIGTKPEPAALGSEGAERSPSRTEPVTSPAQALDHDRVARLEHELAGLRERELRREAAATGEPPEPNQPESAPLTPEQERELLERRLAELEQQYAADPVDPEWAKSASHQLQTGLTQLSALDGASILQTECRTTQCRARVSWKDYQTARSSGLELAQRAIAGLNCVRTILLKEPDTRAASAAAPYAADLYLDCTAQRSGQVDSIPETKGEQS